MTGTWRWRKSNDLHHEPQGGPAHRRIGDLMQSQRFRFRPRKRTAPRTTVDKQVRAVVRQQPRMLVKAARCSVMISAPKFNRERAQIVENLQELRRVQSHLELLRGD